MEPWCVFEMVVIAVTAKGCELQLLQDARVTNSIWTTGPASKRRAAYPRKRCAVVSTPPIDLLYSSDLEELAG